MVAVLFFLLLRIAFQGAQALSGEPVGFVLRWIADEIGDSAS
jgi:hypothetical protein